MYFKNEYHRQQAEDLMKACGFDSIVQNREYGTLCYLVAATYKGDRLLKNFKEDGVWVEYILEAIEPYSSTEKVMIKLGLHLFNSNYAKDITIQEVFTNLDEYNAKAVIEALSFRYNV